MFLPTKLIIAFYGTGDIEVIPGVSEIDLVLEPLCQQCGQFLEFVPGSATENATVTTRRPLDAEALNEVRALI